MEVRPDTLKALRKRNGLSQAQLSQRTAGAETVATVTIKRIEGSTKMPYVAQPRVVRKLAEALRVTPETLALAPDQLGKTGTERRDGGYGTVKATVDGETLVAFQLIEHMYGISVQSQIAMAPLFAAVLAEGSLAWRREQTKSIDVASQALLKAGKGHLAFALRADRIREGMAREIESIEKRDIFGEYVRQESEDLGYDTDRQNPFADYLRELVSQLNTRMIELDIYGVGLWKTAEGLPDYQVAPEFLDELTGEDRWALYALERGFATIKDIPSELMARERIADRIKWLSSKVAADERSRQAKLLDDLII